MIRARVKTRKSTSAVMKKTALQAPRLMRAGAQVVVRRERRDIRADLERKVRKPRHPFIWSPVPMKQNAARRWWYRAVRLGIVKSANGRYVRSGSILRGWKLVSNLNDFDGLITIQNNAPGAEWVVGMKQVPSHAKSGYPRIDKVAMRSRNRIDPKLRALWRTVCRPKIA